MQNIQKNNDDMASEEVNLWWHPEYKFFGEFYIEGDNSMNGYLQKKKQTLNQRTEAEVNGIINLLNLDGKESILDLPCGYGRHSIALAKRGFTIFGCDINPTHLYKAYQESQKQNANVTWILGNMRDFINPISCDVVINMFYSFGFFDSEEDNIRALSNIYKNLKDDGKFLFHTDVNIPRLLSGEYKQYEERSLASGRTLVIKDDYDVSTKRINGFWLIKDGDVIIDKRMYTVRVYTHEEFVELCYKVGFKTTKVYGDWDKTTYSNSSEDMIIIAEK